MSDQVSQNVLVLSPHPDDESFGCGGTVKLISSSGGRVDVVYMTHGELGFESGTQVNYALQENLSRQRTREALLACRILGVASASFLEGHDGRLHLQPELFREILGILERGDYRSVFCPWPHDGHSDHHATYEMLLQALRYYSREIDVWLYEVWTPMEPNMVIPIDAVIDAKMAAMEAHRSQMEAFDYRTAFRSLSQYRSLFCPSSHYAEAFFTCESRALCEDPDLPGLHRRHLVGELNLH